VADQTRPSPGPEQRERDDEGHAAALHEAANALTVILGWIERATEAATAGPEVRAALERASSHALRAHAGLRRAIGADAPAEPPERVDRVARQAVDDLAVEARRAGLLVRYEIAPAWGASTVRHAHAVWQILSNLLLNAIAVTPRGGTVELTVDGLTEPSHRTVLFAVTDQGPGIPLERRELIFAGGPSGRVGGAGIGLRHARMLAREHGAELSLGRSERGARFDLAWPALPEATKGSPEPARASGPPAPPPSSRGQRGPSGAPRAPSAPPPSGRGRRQASAAPPAAPPPALAPPASDEVTARPAAADPRNEGVLRGRTILLLEDDDAVVELLELTLGARGAKVRAIRTAAVLGSTLCEQRFDTLLVDLSPLGGGLQALLDRARVLAPELVVIVVSGSAPGDTLPRVDWVPKPFQPGELVAAIAAAHERRRAGP
jgi:CheY-like chemotaxis protein